ncbi:endo-1,4-beta-xylanase [Prevotella sp. lc2012]|uniref:endo-1,4-beta-xylanase n=1 Tax=Prevotella sp. lc2012 TaxID=1761886 RepID=UPI000B80FE7B|nr:endo-1,4-beta-xylanase [Prevotella sp. lc2012]
MKKVLMCVLAASLLTPTMAQEKFETGKPNNDNYRYLDEYRALKSYIDYSKYPNFKLGIGTTVNDYLNNPLVKNLTNENFTETVAGNAMKMASCVDGNGNMNFTTVKQYVEAATEAGLSIYGHTLAWHSQQPNAWLRKLIADKPDPNSEETFTEIVNKDFLTNKTVGWKSDEATYGYSIKFDTTNGLVIHTTKMCENSWDAQFQAVTDIMLKTGETYKMTITLKGSDAGNLHSKLGDFSYTPETAIDIPFTKEWKDVEIDYTPVMDNNFLLLQCGDFVGDIYIKSIKFEGYASSTIPQTAQERHDTLVYAMDLWIKGMMEACDGKVKAWDLVNEALSGDGDDGEGNYELQHSSGYKSGTWDVGGDTFYWQDHLGDLDYVRQACRLARKYGPEDLTLFINDYNLESDWDDNKKVKSLVNWIKKWEADGVTKIDGIGTQMHISCYEDFNLQENAKKHITKMFEIIAASGKLCRVSEMDMGYVRGSNKWGGSVKTDQLTEDEHKKMADLYEWIFKEYFRLIPAAQQWGICQWCPTDAPVNSGWRGGEPVGIWDLDFYRKHVYAGFVRGLAGGESTGINRIKADKTIDTSKGIYNLNGVRQSAKTLSELPAGIYIVDGKKVVK